MKVLRKLGQWLIELVLIVAIVAVAAGIMRTINLDRFPAMQPSDGPAASDKTAYETSEQVVAIEGDYLNGFHFHPETKSHPGVIVVYGGSEGSPAYGRAEALAAEGYEVLSLFFFGQPNQRPALSDVPLEQFDEVSAYIAEHIADPEPVTVIGTSKGAEFALLLAEYGYGEDAIDNIVAFAPAHYSYSGLDFSSGLAASFTRGGDDVPHASFRNLSMFTGWKMMWETMTAYPSSYRGTYEQAVEKNDDPEAHIDIAAFPGNILLFAGEADRMWQSDVAARDLEAQQPRAEAHIYPDAGHAFLDDAASLRDGWQQQLGGTVDGNQAAYDDSESILRERLAAWH